LIVLVITDETKESEDSLKVVVVVIDVRFLLSFDLSQDLNIIMTKSEAKNEEKFDDSETVVSLFFFFFSFLCLAVSLFFFFCLFLCLAFRSAAFAAVKA